MFENEETRIVYKYVVNPGIEQFSTFGNPEIIHVGPDGTGCVCIWVEQDMDGQGLISLRVAGTGWSFDPTELTHVGSGCSASGLVWHVYQVLTD